MHLLLRNKADSVEHDGESILILRGAAAKLVALTKKGITMQSLYCLGLENLSGADGKQCFANSVEQCLGKMQTFTVYSS